MTTTEAATDTAASSQFAREESLVDEVVRSFTGGSERDREVMCSLVRHLHSFVRDVRLTEAEWTTAIDFLTRVGQITTETRQEFVLLSDVLGISMQTIAVNNEAYGEATEATVFGPFFVADAPQISIGGDIAGGAAGEPCWVEGTVTDTDGNPLVGARIEVWEADEDGFYDVQYNDGRTAARAHLFTDENGRYAFWGLTPTPYPIPHDGPVGEMLEHFDRSPVRASHLHFMVSAPEKHTLVTHIFVQGCAHLANDSVFGVKESLIKNFAAQQPGTPTPDGRDLGARSWTKAHFDVVLPPHGRRTTETL